MGEQETMSENDKATPRPWRWRQAYCIDGENGGVGAWHGSKADLVYAVRAVNCHDELVAACETLLTLYDEEVYSEYSGTTLLAEKEAKADCARSILAKAKGTT